MAVRIDTTVAHAAEELEKFGAPADRHVTMVVLEPGDEEKLADLRQAIAEGDASGPALDGPDFLTELKADLKRTFPENYPG